MTRLVVLLLVGCGSVDSGAPDASSGADAPADATIDSRPDAPGSDGLVAWYRMDAVAAGMADDAVSDHDGLCSATGCPTLAANGRVGGAYLFDGDDDILRVPSSAALETSTAFTVAAWVNGNQIDKDGCFVNKVYGTANENSWQACVKTDGMLFFFSFGSGGGHTQFVRMLDPAKWYHVALWWNGSTKRTYVNGVEAASEDNVSVVFDDQAMTIGCDIDGGVLVAPFNGMIDDVRIYNRALTVPEITALQ